MTGIRNVGAVAIAVCALLTAPPYVESAAAQDLGLRIVVLEGEDSVNIIAQGTAVPTLVEVRDRNDLPVSGASVLFLLGEGGTATLNAGLQQLALTTNALGQAAVAVNPLAAGAVELSVSATFAGETATAAIVQTNFATVGEAAAAVASATGGGGGASSGAAAGGGGGGLGTGAIVGIAGAAAGAAVGVGVATGGEEPSPPPPPSPPATAPPSAPSAPTLTAGDGQLEVRWSAPSDDGGAAIDDYDVRYRTEGGSWTELPDGVKSTATTATIPDLTNGTTYEVQVRAGNSAGDGPWSSSATDAPVAASTAPSAPSPPTLTAGDGQLEVRWSAPSSDGGAAIDDYDVRYRPSGGSWTELPDGVTSTATTATIAGLGNGTTYEVQVRAGNSVGDGPWSASARGTPEPPVTAPLAPAPPTLSPGDGQMVVRWDAPSSDGGSAIDDYDLRYRPAGGSWTEVRDDAKRTARSLLLTDLTNGTPYEVQVRAGNSVGDGPWSASATGTPMSSASVPSAPSAPALAAGDGQLEVGWTAPSDGGAAIDDYDVRYRPVGGSWTELSDAVTSTATTATIAGLTNGMPYEVQVRAGNSVGDGPWSASATGTPESAASVPSAPSPPTLTVGEQQLEVSWSAPSANGSSIDDYDVRYRPVGDSNWTELPDTVKSTATSVTIPGLTNGTPYEVQVRAGNSVGDGPWSASAESAVSVPWAPTTVLLTAGHRQLEADWGEPFDNGLAITDYDVRYRPAGDSNRTEPPDWTELPDAVPSTATTATITGLTNATSYEVQVRAGNSAGDGPWSLSATATPVSRDRASLRALYDTTGGESWINNTNWNSSEPLDQWYGVRTNADDRVTHLELAGNYLNGAFPGRYSAQRHTLATLTNLEVLDLRDNYLIEFIPSSLGNLENLYVLYLLGNRLTGSIPPALCRFEDTINPQKPDRGEGSRYLSGCVLNENIVERSVLMEFYRATDGPNWRNNTNWGRDDKSLDEWYGVRTDADGRVAHLGFAASNKNMTGSIPSSLGNLKHLRSISIGYERELRGPIPDTLGALPRLEALILSWNGLTGSIPSSLGNLPRLKELGLSWNELTGSIPSSLGNLPRLERLNLSLNELTGSIPDTLGGLTNLEGLHLHSNQLGGEIPSSLGRLTELERLTLANNRLTGSIPAALCQFENSINPQRDADQNDVDLPCKGSASIGALEVQLVPGDEQLRVNWTAPLDAGAATDDYDVRYRTDAESGAWTELPDVTRSTVTSAEITGLPNGTVYQVQVRAGNASGDGAWSATAIGAPAVPVERLSFSEARIEDQRYRQYAAIAPVELPAATGGVGVVTYALSPGLPAGLVFDTAARTISGTPSAATSPASYTYTATDASASADEASLSFTLEVEVSAEETALRRDALAAQGRALLSSATGVIGERFRPRQGAQEDGAGMRGAAGALGEALASMLGFREAGYGSPVRLGDFGGAMPAGGLGGGRGGLSSGGSVGGLGGHPGLGAGGLGRLSAAGSSGFGDALPSARRQGASGFGPGGWDGLVWGRSFAAPLGTGEDGGGLSRYTVWGAGDRQSFSGSPAAGRYSGDMRSLYVGADGRIGTDWLAGAAVGRSWGAADYTASVARSVAGRLTTRLTSVYPYVRGQVSRGLELWVIGGYGRGEAADARETEALGAAGALTMRMGAAGLRQDVTERGGVALAVVGGAGSLSLSTSGGGLTVSGLGAGVHRGRLAVEASRASGAVSPFVQLGGRYDGGDGQTGAGLELVAGLRASTSRLDLEARGRWLSAHSAAGYKEYGAAVRLALKSRPDGTGLRALLSPRWGMADELSLGEDSLLGGAGMPGRQRGAGWTPAGQTLSLDGELGYGWRARRLRGVLSPLTSYRRTGFGGDLTQVGLSYLSSEELLRGDVRMQFTLGREQWLEQGAGYQLAVTLLSVF